MNAPYTRLLLAPSRSNGLTHRSWIIVDKITTVNCVRLSRRRRVSRSQIVLLDRAIATFLGIAGGPPPATEEQEL